MTSQLPIVNLSGAVTGQQFTIDFTAYVKFNPAYMSQNAHLAIYNESGCGLSATLRQSGSTFFIPAGGWGIANISPNDSTVLVTVMYILPNPSVSQLVTVYYAPGEETPPSYTLGNSPVSVAQGPTVVTATNLDNEGNAAGTNIINSVVVGDAQSAFAVTNDGIVAIGDAAHGGSLSVVGPSKFTGHISGDGTNNLRLDAGSVSNAIEFDNAGVQKAYLDINGLNMNSNIIFRPTPPGSGFGSNLLMTGGYWIVSDAGHDLFFDTTDSARQFNFMNAGVTAMLLAAAGMTLNVPATFGSTATFNGASVTVNAPSTFTGLMAANSPIFSQANGSVSGSLQCLVFVWGSALKIVLVLGVNNFNTATNVTVSFPGAFSASGICLPGDIGGSTTFSLNKAGVAQTCRQVVYGTAGVAGTTSAQTSLKTANQYAFLAQPDSLQVQTGAFNNAIIIIGV